LYTSTSAGIFRTTQGGNLWENVASHTAKWISISMVDGSTVWTIATNGTAWVTTDDGVTWTLASSIPFSRGNATKILAHPTDVSSAFATFSGYGALEAHIVLTTDLGASWTNVTGDFPSQPVNAIAVDPESPSDWYIGTDVGVWKSEDAGASWIPFEDGFPNTVVVDLEIQRSLRKLVAGTHGRGLWEIDLPLGSTGIEAALDPARLHLLFDPPSPNPLSDRTLLRYAAKTDEPVTLDIFDVTGRRVANLAEFPAGDGIIRTTPWFPDRAPSGVYFAVLRAGSVSKSQKLVVAR
jgi:hypothetical protein